MSNDTPVERRLREMAQRLGGSWSPTETRHAAAIDLGREAIALWRERMMARVAHGVAATKADAAAARQAEWRADAEARALLFRCEQDGPK